MDNQIPNQNQILQPGVIAPGSVPMQYNYPPQYIQPQFQQPTTLMVYTQYVDSLFVQVDVNKTGMIQGTEAVPFLSQSGLAKESLRDIWTISSKGKAYLDLNDWHIAMKLIALAQNGYAVSEATLQLQTPIYFPRFANVPIPQIPPPVPVIPQVIQPQPVQPIQPSVIPNTANDWIQTVDPTTGNTYFINKLTNQISYVNPMTVIPQQAQPQPVVPMTGINPQTIIPTATPPLISTPPPQQQVEVEHVIDINQQPLQPLPTPPLQSDIQQQPLVEQPQPQPQPQPQQSQPAVELAPPIDSVPLTASQTASAEKSFDELFANIIPLSPATVESLKEPIQSSSTTTANEILSPPQPPLSSTPPPVITPPLPTVETGNITPPIPITNEIQPQSLPLESQPIQPPIPVVIPSEIPMMIQPPMQPIPIQSSTPPTPPASNIYPYIYQQQQPLQQPLQPPLTPPPSQSPPIQQQQLTPIESSKVTTPSMKATSEKSNKNKKNKNKKEMEVDENDPIFKEIMWNNYSALLMLECNPSEEETITIVEAAKLMKKSGLDGKVIKEIYLKADKKQKKIINRKKFTFIIESIALALNDVEVSKENIKAHLMELDYPKFDGLEKILKESLKLSKSQYIEEMRKKKEDEENEEKEVKEKPNEKLNKSEIWNKYNKYLFNEADIDKVGYISGNAAVKFLTKSLVPVDKLKIMWELVDKNNSGRLYENDLKNLLELISQYNVNGSFDIRNNNEKLPLPPFEGYENIIDDINKISLKSDNNNENDEVDLISFDNMNIERNRKLMCKYDENYLNLLWSTYSDLLFDVCDVEKKGVLRGKNAVLFLGLSNVNRDRLKLIWLMCDPDKTKELNKIQFLNVIKLISLENKGRALMFDYFEKCKSELELPIFKGYESLVEKSKKIVLNLLGVYEEDLVETFEEVKEFEENERKRKEEEEKKKKESELDPFLEIIQPPISTNDDDNNNIEKEEESNLLIDDDDSFIKEITQQQQQQQQKEEKEKEEEKKKEKEKEDEDDNDENDEEEKEKKKEESSSESEKEKEEEEEEEEKEDKSKVSKSKRIIGPKIAEDEDDEIDFSKITRSLKESKSDKKSKNNKNQKSNKEESESDSDDDNFGFNNNNNNNNNRIELPGRTESSITIGSDDDEDFGDFNVIHVPQTASSDAFDFSSMNKQSNNNANNNNINEKKRSSSLFNRLSNHVLKNNKDLPPSHPIITTTSNNNNNNVNHIISPLADPEKVIINEDDSDDSDESDLFENRKEENESNNNNNNGSNDVNIMEISIKEENENKDYMNEEIYQFLLKEERFDELDEYIEHYKKNSLNDELKESYLKIIHNENNSNSSSNSNNNVISIINKNMRSIASYESLIERISNEFGENKKLMKEFNAKYKVKMSELYEREGSLSCKRLKNELLFSVNLLMSIKEKGYKKYVKNMELMIKKGVNEIESVCALIMELNSLEEKNEILEDDRMKIFVRGISEIFLITIRCVLICKYLLCENKLNEILTHFETLYKNMKEERMYEIIFKDGISVERMYNSMLNELNDLIKVGSVRGICSLCMFSLKLNENVLEFEKRKFHGSCLNMWLKNVSVDGPYSVLFR